MRDVYSGISETNIIKAEEAVAAAAVGKGNSSTRLSCGRKKKTYPAGHSKQVVLIYTTVYYKTKTTKGRC